jgi:hypothetical protein
MNTIPAAPELAAALGRICAARESVEELDQLLSQGGAKLTAEQARHATEFGRDVVTLGQELATWGRSIEATTRAAYLSSTMF